MAVALQRRRLTVDDFHRMAESGVFAQDERLELWDGEIFDMPPMGGRQAHARRQLIAALAALVPDRALLDVQGPLPLDTHSEVYPDVMLLRPRDGGYPSIPEPDDVVLLIEVSDTSLAFDRGVKAGRCAAAGVPEYWVVDVAGACVWTMSHPGPGGYGDVHRHGDGALMAKGVPVEIAALF